MDWVKVIVENLTAVAVVIIMGIVVMLLQWLRTYAKKKWNINITDKQFQMVTGLATQGIEYADEQANKWAKAGERSSGAKKLDAALEFVNVQVKELKLDEMARDALVKLIEAQLPKKRNGILELGIAYSKTERKPPA